MDAALVGTLEAEKGPDGYCLWLRSGTTTNSVVWPYRWTARLAPKVEILDQDGRVVAHEGELLVFGGGGTQVSPERCDHGEIYAVSGVGPAPTSNTPGSGSPTAGSSLVPLSPAK